MNLTRNPSDETCPNKTHLCRRLRRARRISAAERGRGGGPLGGAESRGVGLGGCAVFGRGRAGSGPAATGGGLASVAGGPCSRARALTCCKGSSVEGAGGA